MGKLVGMAEFKAHCTRLLREVEATGESLTVTSRGKPVATVSPAERTEERGMRPAFGMLKGTATIIGDLSEPIDPDWEAEWDAKWDERLSIPEDEPGS